MSESAAQPSTPAPSPWLIHPAVDLLVGAGLLAVPLAALTAVATARAPSVAVIAFGALSLIVNGPHFAATVARALDKSAPSAARAALVIATLVGLALTAAAHAEPRVLAALFIAYLTWSPWHYVTQNHGVSLVFLARAGGPPAARATTGERRALKVAHIAVALAAMVAIHSGLSDPFVRRLGFARDVAFGAAVAGLVVAVLVGGGVLVRLRGRGAPLGGVVAAATLLAASAVWFVVPSLLGAGIGLGAIYVGGGTAVLHCAQYLWMTFFVEGRVRQARGDRFDGLAWGGTVVAGGIALFLVVPWVASRAFGYDLIVSLLIVQAVVNLHHFVVDAFAWKLRDPAVSAPIFAGRELAPARREQTSNGRALVATLGVGALLMLGIVDLIQLAGSRADASAELRARALALNENDSRLWLQEAQLAVQADDVDSARADLGRAVTLSPYNADVQRALLRLHALTGRLDEAWARQTDAPAGMLDDAASLAVLAEVGLRLGKVPEAVALAEQAMARTAAAPGGAEAIEAKRVYGMALLARAALAPDAKAAGPDAGEARRLLREALNEAEAQATGDIVRQGGLLELATALADAHVRLGQGDPALLLYERALDGATKTDRADIAVRALIGRGKVFLEREDARAALDHLQRALRVAEQAKDVAPAAEVARAWLDYGGLLAASEAPMRLRFACALKARQAAERMRAGKPQDDLLTFIVEATRFVEEVLPPAEAETVRSDLEATAKEALGAGYPEVTEE